MPVGSHNLLPRVRLALSPLLPYSLPPLSFLSQKEKELTTPLSHRHSALISARSRGACDGEDGAGGQLSGLERQLLAMEEIRLQHRRQELLDRIGDLVLAFDAELRMLRHEKLSLDTDLKNADLRSGRVALRALLDPWCPQGGSDPGRGIRSRKEDQIL